MTSPTERLLAALRDCTDLPAQLPMYQLSGLDLADVALLENAWPRMATSVRCQVVLRLVELAELDLEMDFGAVYRVGLEDEDAEVRRVAVEGLWEDEDVRLVPRLVSRLLEDEVPAVRGASAASLGRFVLLGELGKIRPGPSAVACQALLRSCRTETDLDVRRRALESLAYVCSEEVGALICEAYSSPDEKMRVSAVVAMGRSAHDKWCDQVRQELFSPNPELRFEGVRACGELALSDAVPDLEELVDDVDREVREAALWSLGQIGGDRARRIVQRCCLSEDEATRGTAESALAELEFLQGELSELVGRLPPESG